MRSIFFPPCLLQNDEIYLKNKQTNKQTNKQKTNKQTNKNTRTFTYTHY